MAVPRLDQGTTHTPVHRLTERGSELHKGIMLDSANTDSGSSPASRFRAGNVVVLDTSELNYVEANDALGDASTPATVSAIETADVDWQNATITLTIDGIQIVIVALGAGDDTDAEVVIALNANLLFEAHAVADAFGGFVRIRAKGLGVSLMNVTSDLVTAFGTAGVDGFATDADYRVTEKEVDLVDIDNVAIDESTVASQFGDYDESELINLTADAKRVLLKRGATFA